MGNIVTFGIFGQIFLSDAQTLVISIVGKLLPDCTEKALQILLPGEGIISQ